MGVKVTDTRECCDPGKDLRPYRGHWSKAEKRWYQQKKLKYCVHCGQLWGVGSVRTPAGDSDSIRILCFPGELDE